MKSLSEIKTEMTQLPKLFKDTRAETNVLVAILTVVVATILIIVAALIVSNVASSIDLSTVSTAANATIAATLTSSYNALNLLTIVLIVLAAPLKFTFRGVKAAIIAAVVGGLMFMRSRRE